MKQLSVLLAYVLTGSLLLSGYALSEEQGDTDALFQAAGQGDGKAAFRLGTRYAAGSGMQQDYKNAAYWFGVAAEQGIGVAQYNLGVLYATGKGVEQNLERAMSWYKMAAEQGIPLAQFNLGTLYGLGKGTEKDEAKAAHWLAKAADQGIARAQYNLGVLYEFGRGVEQNLQTAQELYDQADRQGYEPAGERLASLRSRYGETPPTATVTTDVPPTYTDEVVQETAYEVVDAEPEPVATYSEVQWQPSSAGQEFRSTAWIDEQGRMDRTLQVSTQQTQTGALRFIRAEGIADQAAYFPFHRKGEVWYSVIYGSYPDVQSAEEAAKNLPEGLRMGKPWVRRFGAIQESMVR